MFCSCGVCNPAVNRPTVVTILRKVRSLNVIAHNSKFQLPTSKLQLIVLQIWMIVMQISMIVLANFDGCSCRFDDCDCRLMVSADSMIV
jgi:hypothetical protein